MRLGARFRELTSVFFKLGCLGFGGPIATIAMMEEEACRKRQWLGAEEFGQVFSVLKMMPGPFATQMAIYLGTLRAGRLGGLLSGSLFVLPSFFLVLGLSYFYVHYGIVHSAGELFYGFQVGALAVIAISCMQLATPFLRRPDAWGVALASILLVFVVPRIEPVLILAFGLLGAAKTKMRPNSGRALSVSPALLALFWICFKSGAFVFGSGLAIVPLLESETVMHYHWLTHAEFMDGLAFGQITPGPVVITATFIGYKVAGVLGAAVATFGMFLPPFVLVLFVLPKIWNWFSVSPSARGFTAWAVPAVVGCIAGSSIRLGVDTLNQILGGVIFIVALAIGLKYRKTPGWALILGSGAVAEAIHLLS